MENMLDNYQMIFLIVFLCVSILFITNLILIIKLNKAHKRYKNLLKGMGNANLEEIILHNSNKISNLENIVNENKAESIELKKHISNCLNKFYLKRYDAFNETGGRQSFSVALLDDTGTGILLTTIHGRNNSYTYAKEIVKGNSPYNLSKEEKEVVEKAINCEFIK